MTTYDVEIMFRQFEKFAEQTNCIFKVRLDKQSLPKNYNKNTILVTEEKVKQQYILGFMIFENYY